MASGTISFELSTDITYVAGTVNGVETVFIQDLAARGAERRGDIKLSIIHI